MHFKFQAEHDPVVRKKRKNREKPENRRTHVYLEKLITKELTLIKSPNCAQVYFNKCSLRSHSYRFAYLGGSFPAFRSFSIFFRPWDRVQRKIWRGTHVFGQFLRHYLVFYIICKNSNTCAKFRQNWNTLINEDHCIHLASY